MDDKAQVIVATNAFGMGIDKADVKTVIHINFQKTSKIIIKTDLWQKWKKKHLRYF
jgi:superfamily II DNA/RNA helicase